MTPLSRGTRWSTLAGTATGLQPLLDRLTPPGIGIADTEFRRGNRALREVLMHCGGPNTRHFRGRIHIDEIKGWGLESGLGVLVHSVQCGASLALQRGLFLATQWATVPRLIPSSQATSATDLLVSLTIPTTPARKSGSYLLRVSGIATPCALHPRRGMPSHS
jgi:hypothetical protein